MKTIFGFFYQEGEVSHSTVIKDILQVPYSQKSLRKELYIRESSLRYWLVIYWNDLKV